MENKEAIWRDRVLENELEVDDEKGVNSKEYGRNKGTEVQWGNSGKKPCFWKLTGGYVRREGSFALLSTAENKQNSKGRRVRKHAS